MTDDPGREERVHLIVEIRRSLFHVFCAINPTPRQQRQFLEDAIIDALAQAIKSEADPKTVRRALSVLLGLEPPMTPVPGRGRDPEPGPPPASSEDEDEDACPGRGRGRNRWPRDDDD